MKKADILQCIEITRSIIRDNKHLTLATSGEYPWATPLCYCTDNQYNFYFVSRRQSLHVQQFKKQPQVAFTIANASKYQNGIQAVGQVIELKGLEIVNALQWYKTDFMKVNLKTLSGVANYRLYKLVPEHIYIQDPINPNDQRLEIPLDQL